MFVGPGKTLMRTSDSALVVGALKNLGQSGRPKLCIHRRVIGMSRLSALRCPLGRPTTRPASAHGVSSLPISVYN